MIKRMLLAMCLIAVSSGACANERQDAKLTGEVYAATDAGLIGKAKALAHEIGEVNVRNFVLAQIDIYQAVKANPEGRKKYIDQACIYLNRLPLNAKPAGFASEIHLDLAFLDLQSGRYASASKNVADGCGKNPDTLQSCFRNVYGSYLWPLNNFFASQLFAIASVAAKFDKRHKFNYLNYELIALRSLNPNESVPLKRKVLAGGGLLPAVRGNYCIIAFNFADSRPDFLDRQLCGRAK